MTKVKSQAPTAAEEAIGHILFECPHGVTRHFCGDCQRRKARAESLARHPSAYAIENDADNVPGPHGPWAMTDKGHSMCPWCDEGTSQGDRLYLRETLEGEELYVCLTCADWIDEEDAAAREGPGGDDAA